MLYIPFPNYQMENNQSSPADDGLPEEIEIVEMELVPVSEWEPVELPVYNGPPPKNLHLDRWCACDVRYENEITVPKRHSLISVCPKCGCVTVD